MDNDFLFFRLLLITFTVFNLFIMNPASWILLVVFLFALIFLTILKDCKSFKNERSDVNDF